MIKNLVEQVNTVTVRLKEAPRRYQRLCDKLVERFKDNISQHKIERLWGSSSSMFIISLLFNQISNRHQIHNENTFSTEI